MFNHSRSDGVLPWEQEKLVSAVQEKMVAAALSAGEDVVIDDLNLRPKYVSQWIEFAHAHGAEWLVVPLGTDVETCVARDAAREEPVGESVIRELARKFMPKGVFMEYTVKTPSELKNTTPYVAPKDKPYVVIVDIDGTIADMGSRHPHDYASVGGDSPRYGIILLVESLLREGYMDRVIFVSGRPDSCRPETTNWLQRNTLLSRSQLLMRKTGDHRPDDIVKLEIFNEHIREKYNVVAVFDDRNRVVQMWRSLGLNVLQVADGNF